MAGCNEHIDNNELVDRVSARVAEDSKVLTWDARAVCVMKFIETRLSVLGK